MKPGVDAAIGRFHPSLPLVVAFSGGADSTALLLACAMKWPGQVMAVHVHHGLQPAADAFVHHCQQVCTKLSVPLAVRRVDARHQPGESPEDAARRMRYRALAAAAIEDFNCLIEPQIAIAQHADDQVETLLLALTRGAGLPGLSAMRSTWTRAHDGLTVRFHRPMLQVAAADIRRWLASRGVPFIDDPTNLDERLTRNRIRARVMPALAQGFPAFLDTFARSARHAAQAQMVLDEMAMMDLAATGVPPSIAALRRLSPARLANALRCWLRLHYQAAASTAQLDELVKQVQACATRGHRIEVRIGRGSVCRQGQLLCWGAKGEPA